MVAHRPAGVGAYDCCRADDRRDRGEPLDYGLLLVAEGTRKKRSGGG